MPKEPYLHRTQFECSPQQHEYLRQIKQKLGDTTDTAVIRKGIYVLGKIIEVLEKGGQFSYTLDGRTVEIFNDLACSPLQPKT